MVNCATLTPWEAALEHEGGRWEENRLKPRNGDKVDLERKWPERVTHTPPNTMVIPGHSHSSGEVRQ